MADLTDRQLQILAAVVREYTTTPEPVSSKQIVEVAGVGVSSATIRNELVTLEQLGLVRSPHTSAGRVPTQEGYRYFVQHFVTPKNLAPVEQRNIRAEVEIGEQDLKKWLRTAANVLARRTESAALVTEPRSQVRTFKHVQLISTHGHMVLMVLVLEGGDLVQHMLTLKEIPEQERLTQAAAYLNDLCHGLNANQMRQKLPMVADHLVHDVLDLLVDVLDDSSSEETFALHLYGFSDVVPQFGDREGAQQVLKILDNRSLIDDVLTEAIDSDDPVKVLIAGGGRDEISELSIVVGRYGNDTLKGAISVLGPTRMRYGRAISTVRYVATLMSAMMEDMYGKSDT